MPFKCYRVYLNIKILDGVGRGGSEAKTFEA